MKLWTEIGILRPVGPQDDNTFQLDSVLRTPFSGFFLPYA